MEKNKQKSEEQDEEQDYVKRRYKYPTPREIFGKSLCKLIFGKDSKKFQDLELSPAEFCRIVSPYLRGRYLGNLVAYWSAGNYFLSNEERE